MRYDNIKFWIPPSIYKLGIADNFIDLIVTIEEEVKALMHATDIDNMKNFTEKKKLTSALRRITPNGIANNILFSFNGRSLRHIFQMRSSKHAEEEMQFVFEPLMKKLITRLPNLLQDFQYIENTHSSENDWEYDEGEWIYKYEKV